MSVGGNRGSTVSWILIATALLGLAAPVAADQGSYTCTVLVGTEVTMSSSGPTGASASNGAGECKLHTLQDRSEVLDVDAPQGCGIFADVDDDAFVERAVERDDTYEAGTSFVAFCELGVTMADNEVFLGNA